MMKRTLLILIFNLSLALIGAIKWNEDGSASSCDFAGGTTLRSAKISFEECKKKCSQEEKCTHYTFRGKNLCKLKSNPVTRDDALNVDDSKIKCGIVLRGKPAPSKKGPPNHEDNDEDTENENDEYFCEIYERAAFKGNKLKMKDGNIEIFQGDEAAELSGIRSLRIRENCRMQLCFNKSMSQCHHFSHSFEFKRNQPVAKLAICNCGPSNMFDKSTRSAGSTVINFKRPGKGTIRFAIRPLAKSDESFNVRIGNDDVSHTLTFSGKDVNMEDEQEENYEKKIENEPPRSLTHFNASENYIWISIEGYLEDPPLGLFYFIKVGYGYAMEKNLLFSFYPKNKETKEFIRSIAFINVDKKVVINQITSYVNLMSFHRDQNPALAQAGSLTAISSGYITPAILPPVGIALFDTIKDMNIDSELLDAINFSLDTDGCMLNTKLKSKTTFSKKNSKSSYIRVSLNSKTFSSPGLPFVLEIWPKGHSSPVHNHGDCVAVIKVLRGSLQSDFYNPLANSSYEKPVKFASYKLHEGNFTWMTPDFYQTHLLFNYRNDTAAITIQSYSHLEESVHHDEKFNYVVEESPLLHVFYPKSDYLFDDVFTNTLRREYKAKKCNSNSAGGPKNVECNFKGRKCGSVLKEMEKYSNDKSIKEDVLYYCDKSGASMKVLKACPAKYECSVTENLCVRRNPARAVIQMKGVNGNKISGTLEMVQTKIGEISLTGELFGMNKKSTHGLHIYESKDCTDLGPHFDPYMTNKHGNIKGQIFDRHLGDLGNIKSDSKGKAKVNVTLRLMTIEHEESDFSIIDRVIAISQAEDDLGKSGILESNINGNSGEAIACGAIVASPPVNAYVEDEDEDPETYDPEKGL